DHRQRDPLLGGTGVRGRPDRRPTARAGLRRGRLEAPAGLRRGRCAAQASSPARVTSIGQPSVTCPSVTGASGAMLTSMHSVTGAPAVVRVPPGSVAGYPAVEASTGLGVVRSPSRRLREPLSKVGAAHVPWLDSTARM